jgi:hypothetical protein
LEKTDDVVFGHLSLFEVLDDQVAVVDWCGVVIHDPGSMRASERTFNCFLRSLGRSVAVDSSHHRLEVYFSINLPRARGF